MPSVADEDRAAGHSPAPHAEICQLSLLTLVLRIWASLANKNGDGLGRLSSYGVSFWLGNLENKWCLT